MDSRLMKSIKLSLLATAALASLTITMTMQQQSVAAFNDQNQLAGYAHDHSTCDTSGCTGNSGGALNSEHGHLNFNCNPQRASDECRVNTHDRGN
jgi:invasion protein IalB